MRDIEFVFHWVNFLGFCWLVVGDSLLFLMFVCAE